MRKVSVVIPVYNESSNVMIIVEAIQSAFQKLLYNHEIIFVNDGSHDDTEELLEEQSRQHGNIFFISLSRNFGHQNALKAGLDHATGDCVISMDGDMQHPPHLIPDLIAKWEEGYDIVYTRRLNSRNTGFFKKKTSWMFYKFINIMSDVPIEEGTADFRLLDRKVVDKLKGFKETDPFLRGLIKWVGFKQCSIEYKPLPRFSGTTKYTIKKMIRFAIEGVTSFSIRPLIFSVYLGFFFSLLSIAIYIPYLANAILVKNHFPRWASILSLVVFFGGLNLTILGIIGIYVGKLFMQSKARPNYIIKETNLVKTPIVENDLVKL